MNDPRMLNDPAMAGALEPVKEIHAIRLMLQDETVGMNAIEKATFHKQGAAALFSSLGLPPLNYVNLSGKGKLKPKTTAAV